MDPFGLVLILLYHHSGLQPKKGTFSGTVHFLKEMLFRSISLRKCTAGCSQKHFPKDRQREIKHRIGPIWSKMVQRDLLTPFWTLFDTL